MRSTSRPTPLPGASRAKGPSVVDYGAIAIAIAGAVFFYKAAEHENRSTIAWTALSVLVSGALIFLLHAGIVLLVLGQVALVLAIGLWRMWRETDAGESKSEQP